MKRLQHLVEECRQLKRISAGVFLDLEMLQDVIKQMQQVPSSSRSSPTVLVRNGRGVTFLGHATCSMLSDRAVTDIC